jgi:hypothetical protein
MKTPTKTPKPAKVHRVHIHILAAQIACLLAVFLGIACLYLFPDFVNPAWPLLTL